MWAKTSEIVLSREKVTALIEPSRAPPLTTVYLFWVCSDDSNGFLIKRSTKHGLELQGGQGRP